MIRAKLSLELIEGDKVARDTIEVTAKDLKVLRPMVLRTTLLSFAESAKETMDDPAWETIKQLALPTPGRSKRKKSPIKKSK